METQQPHPTNSRSGRSFLSSWRVGLDVLSAVAMIAAAATLIWVNVWRPNGPPPPTRQEISAPTEPIALDQTSMRGARTAKVALIEYSDFQCPFCGKFSTEILPEIDREYIQKGQLLFSFRHYPLSNIHSLAVKAAEFAECAGQQGNFWQMHDLLFKTPGTLDEAGLGKAVDSLGLNTDQFATCLSGSGKAKVARDSQSADKLKLPGTPGFLFGIVESNYRVRVTKVSVGAKPLEEFRSTLNDLIRQTGGN